MADSEVIPYIDFSHKNSEIRADLINAFEKVIDGGQYIQGTEVLNFESEFAQYCGTNFGIGLANGTCSLTLILKSFKFPTNSEVITAPNSFIASASSITLAGLRPVFVDVSEDMNMNPELLEEAITENTRAIMPVHLTGRPAKMEAINQIAKRHNLIVIEDAAQAVGAMVDGKKVGGLGDFASFSLHPLKNLHAYGDAGIVTCNSEDTAKRLQILKNHGLVDRSTCDIFSSNCRLDEMQAAFLRIQLRKLDAWTLERRRLAHRYNEKLNDVVDVPVENSNEYHVYQTYMIKASNRDNLQKHLKTAGVETSIHYPVPIHLQPAAKNLGYKVGDFPITEKLSHLILSLPLYVGLSEKSQDYVIEHIRNFYERKLSLD